MLSLIQTQTKRDNYTTYVTNIINQMHKGFDDDLRKREKSIEAREKKGEDVADEKRNLHRLRREIPGKLGREDLKSYLKDFLSEKAKKEQIKQTIDQKVNASLDLNSLNLPDDFEGDVADVLAFNVYQHNNRIFSKLPKEGYMDVSNFSMQNLYHIATDGDAAYRIIRVKNVFGFERDIQINTDDLISTTAFKKVMARQGNFVFKGSDADLNRINEMLQKDETPLKYVDILGHDLDNDFYAFGNGVLDTGDTGEFLEADATGVVTTNRGSFYLPAFSKMFAHKRDLFQTEKNFLFRKKDTIRFKRWADVHAAVWAERGIFGQLWVINALFRDITIANNQTAGTPILCLAGQPGSGKDTFTKGLLRLFGNPPGSINLGGQSTVKGFMRKFSQIRNGVVWINEYKNNLDKHVIGSLKGIYDGDGYVRAVKSNDFQTDNTPINSAMLLSGQDMPTIENALLMRTVLLTFDKREKYTEIEMQMFDKLQAVEREGLSNVIHEILMHRSHVQQSFDAVYAKTLTELYALVNDRMIDDRYIHNYALLVSMYEMLKDKLDFPYNRSILNSVVVQQIKMQYQISQHSNEIAKFWQVVEHLVNTGLVRPGVHYRFAENKLFVRVQDIYPFYVKEMKAQSDMTTLSLQSLGLYFKNDTATYVGYQKQRIGVKGGGADISGDSQWCHVFNSSVLLDKYDITLRDHRMNADNTAEPVPFPKKETTDNKQNDLPF